MTEKTTISNGMLSALLSSIPIILVGLGHAMSIRTGPWSGSAMPMLFSWIGFYGWLLVLISLSRRNEKIKFTFNNLTSYIGSAVGLLTGIAWVYYGKRELNTIWFTFCVGTFWGSSLSTIRTPSGRVGLIISITSAFLFWIVLSLLLHLNDSVSCTLQYGLTGILLIGFIGGIIWPVVHDLRRTSAYMLNN